MNARARRTRSWLHMLLILSSCYTFLHGVSLILQVFGIDFLEPRWVGSFRIFIGLALVVSAASTLYVARSLGRRIQQEEADEIKEHRLAIERRAEELVRAKIARKDPKTL